jgi:uroporphyrinogen decarboxylase
MNFKERFLTAMNHEEPDRVPVMGMIMDPATVNRVLGKETLGLLEMMKKPELRSAIRDALTGKGSWEEGQYKHTAGTLECAIQLGFDANWTLYSLMELEPEPELPQGLLWHDVFGRLWEMGCDEAGNLTYNYTGPLCETEEKWEAWIEEKAPLFDKMIDDATRFHKKLVEEYGERILPIGFSAPGVFENSWQPIGFVNFTKLIYEKPEFVRRITDFYADFCLRHIEAVMESGLEVVLAGDDLGQKTGPMLRPELIEKLYGESYRRLAEAVHRKNKKLIFHSCGNVHLLLDKFVEWGFDGLITLEPTAGMDLGRVRDQVAHKLVLIGNLDVSHLLVKGSRQEIEDAVKKAIRDAARGGGYILSACHSHPSVDPVRLGWMVEAAHHYGQYPIRI